MNDYSNTITKAKKLSLSANELRNQASKLNNLLDKMSTSYEGKDAQACGAAINNIRNEMNMTSNELDKLADLILRNANKKQKEAATKLA